MVTLIAPLETEDRFFLFQNLCLLGPHDSTGRFRGDRIELPDTFGTLEQSRGIWGDNNVTHTKVSGTISYDPLYNGAIPYPSSRFPDQWKFPLWRGTSYTTVLTAPLGLATDKCVRMDYTGVSTTWVYAYQQDPIDQSWWIWNLSAQSIVAGGPHSAVYNHYMYHIKSIDSYDSLYCHFTFDKTTYAYRPGGSSTRNDWRVRPTFDDVLAEFEGLKASSYSANAHDFYYWYRYYNSTNTIWSPQKAQEHVAAITRQLVPDPYPIPDVNYGDLAMVASEKVNVNSVNMIAFLRDLTHPTEMIPKLRNLTKIKGIADNFLTVKYGVLPTVGDLRKIVSAFSRIKPFIDKNGLSTYNASNITRLDVDENIYQLEQRIKLAIGDEDSQFQELIERLESLGTLPTFENLWDLVPYSFVVDWFIDVGGFLERVDTRLRLSRLNIRYATMSRKAITTGELLGSNEQPYTGTVQVVQYHRWVTDHCPVPPLSLQPTFQDFSHWLESSALITQRTKR